MSSAPDTHGHDAPDAHAFTGEPVQVLPADEPRTPGWLPLLGIALFTGAAIVSLVGHSNAEVPGVPAPAAPTTTAVAVLPERAAPAPARPMPGQPGQQAGNRPTPPDPMGQMRRPAGQPRVPGLPPDPGKRPAPAR